MQDICISLTHGPPWTALNFISKNQASTKSRRGTTTAGRVTTTWHLFFVFARMAQFLSPFLTCQGRFTTARPPIRVTSTWSLRQCTSFTAASVPLIMRFAPATMCSSSSRQDHLISNAEKYEAQCADIQVAWEATAMRQATEWGMSAAQTSFPWLSDRFKYEEKGKRWITLKMMVLLYNMCACLIGINQICNIYMPLLEQDVHNYLGLWFLFFQFWFQFKCYAF